MLTSSGRCLVAQRVDPRQQELLLFLVPLDRYHVHLWLHQHGLQEGLHPFLVLLRRCQEARLPLHPDQVLLQCQDLLPRFQGPPQQSVHQLHLRCRQGHRRPWIGPGESSGLWLTSTA